MVESRTLANAIRVLSMDAVQRAGSGHPGAPMGMADIMEVLWRHFLRHDPSDPNWPDRDRFVLSNGHASMVLYSVLHLSGYDLSIEDLKKFRQLGSPTAGHPEYGDCPGVETTTGPLGQGFAMSVGMALAEKLLAQEFNMIDSEVIDHRTWVVVGDGCLMEGISHEAASFAGTLGLEKLICLYDQNGISIDGDVSGWFTEDVPGRFRAYGWRVIENIDGHDSESIENALRTAVSDCGKPTLVCFSTKIGFGSPNKEGSESSHGSALGTEEVSLVRENLGWDLPEWQIPEELYKAWDQTNRGARVHADWDEKITSYRRKDEAKAEELFRRLEGKLPSEWSSELDELAWAEQSSGQNTATRKSSEKCIGKLVDRLPEVFGGSADLTGSNLTSWEGAGSSRYLNYGVREFAMTSITNGMILHGGFRPFSGTFLVFMEYGRNAVRLASLMRLPNIFVYTHDSIAVGEDGPTHQPVEQLTNLRTTPNLSTWRPCDGVETAFAWKAAVSSDDKPTALVLSRQTTDLQLRSEETFSQISRGAYILKEPENDLQGIIMATGSEVSLAMQAADILNREGFAVRVVSMPCVDIFLEQESSYRESILPSQIRVRLAVEAAHPDYWRKFVGLEGAVIGVDTYGKSAPGGTVMELFGLNAKNVVSTMRNMLKA